MKRSTAQIETQSRHDRDRIVRMTSWAFAALLPLLAAEAQTADPIQAIGGIELEDPAGDMGMISTSGEPRPPLDLVGLRIKTDGEQVTVTATLAKEPGSFADTAVELYIDADNDPETGLGESSISPAGFDYQLDVQLCMRYDNGASACAGGTDRTVTERWAAVELKRFEADHPYGQKTDLIGTLFAGELRKSERWPVEGLEVQASILYSDIGVASGETIRLRARESGGTPLHGDGSFPIVLLTLE